MKNVRRCLIAVLGALLAGVATVQADVRLPEVISNNMVLQKDIPLPICDNWSFSHGHEGLLMSCHLPS